MLWCVVLRFRSRFDGAVSDKLFGIMDGSERIAGIKYTRMREHSTINRAMMALQRSPEDNRYLRRLCSLETSCF